MLNITGYLLAILLLLIGAPALSTTPAHTPAGSKNVTQAAPVGKESTEHDPKTITTPAGGEPQANTNHTGKPAAGGSQWWLWFYDHGPSWWLTIVTTLLAVFTGGLWLSTRKLVSGSHDIAREQIALQKTQTSLMEMQKNIIHSAERAYVQMLDAGEGLRFVYHIGNSDSVTEGTISFSTKIRNYGNTPAHVTRVCLCVSLLEQGQPLPRTPSYDGVRIDFPVHAFIGKDDGFSYPFPEHTIAAEDVARIDNGEKTLYVLGFVDYTDQFQTHHRAGYARYYYPKVRLSPGGSNLMFVTEDGYNYDRQRSADEVK